jgi:4-amino-4-deoxy-L-arabinose transferase-like glycosyltransferase
MRIFKLHLSDIRFWIILFFLLRLFAITDPPLEVAHHWRQTTVTMAARNFLEDSSNILLPRIDFAGEKTGITGMEFPLLNYLIYLLSLVFGYAHWYGRLINLAVTSVGLYFFWRLLVKYRSPYFAFNATILLLFSIWFTYARKIMPDTFSMSFVIMAMYYASNYFENNGQKKALILYGFFALLGMLSKLPSGYCLVLLFPLFVAADKRTKVWFAGVSLFCVVPVVVYYFYWVPYITTHYGFYHFFMGKSMVQGFREIMFDLPNFGEKFYLDGLQVIGFVLFLVGLFYARIKRDRFIGTIALLGGLAFLVVIGKAGLTFSRHSYYMVPFAPIMAVVAAFALEQLKNKKWVVVLLLAIGAESVANKFHDFYISDKNKAILSLETVLDRYGSRDQKILINSGEIPTPMYFAHRKGWIAYNSQIQNTDLVHQLKALGLKHVVILKQTFGENLKLNYPVLFDSEHFTVYQP